ncbi:MAG: hypothetical protein EXS16_12120 [Gemmataceae bacterium]|nr:hypothetical protein [Gemmataceae bacterium]
MVMIRCSQCNAPMTDDEASTGVCPGCGAVVQRAVSIAVPGVRQGSAAPPSMWRSALLAAIGGVLFFMLPIVMLFYFSTPDRPEKKDEKKIAEAKKETHTEKKTVVPEKKKMPDSEPKKEDVVAKPKTEEPKSVDPMPPVKKEEPKKVEIVKKEEPKIVEVVKKEEPKNVEIAKKPDEVKKVPQPIRQVGNLVLPLLGDDAIKIDGDLSDWRDIPPVFLNAVERGRSPKKVVLAPPTQKAFVGYSSRGILVGVDVVDTSGDLENVGKPARGMWNFWDNDGVEVYIDTLNSRSPRRGPASIHQFFAMPFGTGDDAGVGGYESKILGNPQRPDWKIEALSATGRNAMPRVGKKTPTGWTLEFLIPRSALRENDAKPGVVLGLEVQIDTGTNIYYFWANDNPATHVSMTPSAWGEVILGGSDARLELLDAKSQPTKGIAVGDSLNVRVTDRDANFDANAKGKLSVSLRASSGDVKSLVLAETEVGSGVYLGTIGTVAKSTRRDADKLEVLPNASISLEYLDQVRANGDRNILLRSEIPVR